jgi:hypothetical protein
MDVINPRRINQMYVAIMHGVPWQDMRIDPPLDEEEIEFFEAVKEEYDEDVAKYGSCELQLLDLVDFD